MSQARVIVIVFTVFVLTVTLAACSGRQLVYEKRCRIIVAQENVKDQGEYEVNDNCELIAKPDDG